MTSFEEKIKRTFLRNEKVFSTQQVTLMFLTQQVILYFHAMWHADDHNYLFGKFLLTRRKYVDEMTSNDQCVIDSTFLRNGLQNYRYIIIFISRDLCLIYFLTFAFWL